MHQINSDHTNATAGQTQVVRDDRYQTRPFIAFIWMAIAWIVGTIFFELAATGAEFPNLDPDSVKQSETVILKWGHALDQDETSVCLSISPLEGLFRVESNSKVRPMLDAIIQTETTKLALMESTKSIQLATDDTLVDDEVIGMDEMVQSMPVTNSAFRSAYEQLEQNSETLRLSDRRQIRQAYNDAKLSSLPGLVRLTAHADTEAFEPIYIEAVPFDEDTSMPMYPPLSVATPPVRATDQPESEPPVKQPVTMTVLAKDMSAAAKTVVQPASVRSAPTPVQIAPTPIMPTPIMPAEANVGQVDPAKATTEQQNLRPLMMANATVVKTQPISLPGSPSPATDTIAPASPSDRTMEIPVVVDETNSAPAEHPQPALVAETVAEQSPPTAATTLAQAIVTQPPTPEPATNHQPIRQPDERIAAKWPFAQPAAQPAANGTGVSLNVDNADVRSVFEMLARGYGMNILVSPEVVGTVTANVEGLTPEQTLNGVLKMCDLRAQVEGEMIYIYPPDKLPANARNLRLFPLDFARSEVLEPIVQGLLSPIGNAYASKIDEQDNMKTQETIVVVDTPESLARIESYISQADQPPRQVMIEARVLEIELVDSMKHGVDIGAALGGDIAVGSIGLADPTTTGPLFFTSIDGSRIDALMDLLETTTDAKTLASPKVMVVNGQQAKIQVGQQLGFTVATVTQTSTIQDVQFLDTGVVLSVKPTISRDGRILMDVKPEVSNGQINPDTLLPEEETRELETSVMLSDHQGVVIGGLIQENDRTIIRKLPWLGDVKHVGKLFQHREAVRSRSEIVIALVAHIVRLDEVGGYECCDEEQRQIELQRVNTPLLQGRLQRVCRPWEARLPDSAGSYKHMDVDKINRMMP